MGSSRRRNVTVEKTDRKQFGIIFAIAFFIYMASQMIGTTVGPYADTLGAGAQYIGMITGAFGFMALLPRPISGQIVDKENNKLLMFIVLAFCVVSSGMMIFAQTPFLLMISRGVYGLGWGVGSTLCLTSACNTLSQKDMLRGIAVYTLGQTLAMVLGPSAALMILMHGSYRLLYTICTALMVVGFLLVFAYRSKSTGHPEMRYSIRVNEMFSLEVYAPAIMSVCGAMICAGTTAFVILYAADRGVTNVNWFFTMQAAVILAFRPIMTRFVGEKHLVPVTLASFALYGVYLVVVTAATSWYHFAAAAVLMGVAMGGSQPALFNLCVNAVPPERRGRATNTNYAGNDVGAFLGPYMAGLVSGRFGYRYIFLLMLIPLVIAMVIFCLYYRKSLHSHR